MEAYLGIVSRREVRDYAARPSDPARRSAEEWVARAKRKPYDEVVREI